MGKWREIPGFSHYEINKKGKVREKNTKFPVLTHMRREYINSDAEPSVILYDKRDLPFPRSIAGLLELVWEDKEDP